MSFLPIYNRIPILTTYMFIYSTDFYPIIAYSPRLL